MADMEKGITIAYITMRRNPMFEWFWEGLKKQAVGKDLKIQLIIIDFWKDERTFDTSNDLDIEVLHTLPLPSVWQGKHKITTQEWYACANARNTAFVYAKYDYVASVDDLTVLGDRWMEAVIDAVNGGYIALGAYSKQYEMKVENGVLISGLSQKDGQDMRWNLYQETKTKTHGGNFYGCSCVVPLEAALDINGYDCLTDSVGYEDTVFGIRLENAGYELFYDKRLFTTESNDHPKNDLIVKRIDKMLGEEKYFEVLKQFNIAHSTYPKGANKDCSHIIVDVAKKKKEAVWNFFSLRELRGKENITLEDMKYPEHTWFDRTNLREDYLIQDIR